MSVVLLVGVYSTKAHPSGLIYEYMDGLMHPDNRRRELPDARTGRTVWESFTGTFRRYPLYSFRILAAHSSCTHSGLDEILANKDGTPHIAGLGNAYLLPYSSARTLRSSTELPSDGRAPESSWPGMSLGATSSACLTKANGMCAFGVVIFEVWREPFARYFSARSLEARFRGAAAVLWAVRYSSRVLNAERLRTIAT